jgi:hypothetical protein
MSEESASAQRTPGLSALNGSAFSKFEDAIQRKACVVAVEDGIMSENEAIRYLKMGTDERYRSELGVPDEYLHRAKDELVEEWSEWYGAE